MHPSRGEPAGAASAPRRLEVGNLSLRPWREGDVPVLRAAAADPLLHLWSRLREDDASITAWLSRARLVDEGQISWAVEEGGAVVGHGVLYAVSTELAKADAGYWLLPQARGRGVASAVLRALRRVAFGDLGLERLQLFHAVDNEASCRVATAAGLRWEGTLRRAFRYGDGRLHDEHVHAVVAGDPEPVHP